MNLKNLNTDLAITKILSRSVCNCPKEQIIFNKFKSDKKMQLRDRMLSFPDKI